MVFGVAGCGSSDPAPGADLSPAATTAAEVVTVRDPWVKAADKGMTAAFGTLVNSSRADVTVVSASTSVSPMELHEMTMKDGKMVMQPKAGGIVIKANSEHVLQPGGDHLMLMNVASPVKAGDELTFTLTFADGKSVQFSAIAKPFTGAGESYDPGHPSMSPGMSMSPST
ncbi:copper chaperone PCu(A)C [Micromonospora sp. NBC_01412]